MNCNLRPHKIKIDRLTAIFGIVLGGIGGASTPVYALSFNLRYDFSGNTGLTTQQQTDFKNATQFVANEYSSLFTNNVTLNINVVAGNSGLGSSSTSIATGLTYNQLKPALTRNTPSLSLPTTNPLSNNFSVSTAQAKALGFIQPNSQNLDGIFTFNSNLPYSFSTTSTPVGSYDFTSVVEHEFAEIMGKIDGYTSTTTNPRTKVTTATNYASTLNLFSYTAPNVRSSLGAAGSYFSLDNGNTRLNTFNTNPAGDSTDWAGATLDPFNAFASPGTKPPLLSQIPVDILALNAIGWSSSPNASAITNAIGIGTIGTKLGAVDPVTPVPEPFTVIGTLVGGAAALRLKKQLKLGNKNK